MVVHFHIAGYGRSGAFPLSGDGVNEVGSTLGQGMVCRAAGG